MNKGFLNIKNGLFCISVVASSAFANYESGPIMYINDLIMFQIDCANKKQQVELLQSMRRSKTELMYAKLIGNWTAPGPVATERTNWMIDQLLTEIRQTCYD